MRNKITEEFNTKHTALSNLVERLRKSLRACEEQVKTNSENIYTYICKADINEQYSGLSVKDVDGDP